MAGRRGESQVERSTRAGGAARGPLRLSPKYSATAHDKKTARGLFVGEQRRCEEVVDVSMLVW